MRWRDWGLLAGVGVAAGVATFVYGMLHEAERLTVEDVTLPLPRWPAHLDGYRIAVIADLHVRGPQSLALAKRAIAHAILEAPDMLVLAGDVVAYWKPEMPQMIGDLLEPLLLMEGKAIAIAGNHEYDGGTPDPLVAICNELNVKFLRNESWVQDGITWVGIDSYNAGASDIAASFAEAEGEPRLVLWHEPDLVAMLPPVAALQISGHSHGGQFTFPGGFTPIFSENGRRYHRGFYPDAPTPLYVSRGVGTTGFPSRLNCPPEVSILTLTSA
ncbi:hypothetical protein EON81_16325 [bacterium]|nr:MAG: hypothetical protein EON81_16325 [bacterium]